MSDADAAEPPPSEAQQAAPKRARLSRDSAAASPHKMPMSANRIKVPMYALDCEMCITAAGMEVTRLSMVDVGGKVRDPHRPLELERLVLSLEKQHLVHKHSQ